MRRLLSPFPAVIIVIIIDENIIIIIINYLYIVIKHYRCSFTQQLKNGTS